MDDIEIRSARPGDGPACARVWLDIGRFFIGVDPTLFRLPEDDGLVDWFEDVIASLTGSGDDALYLVALVGGEIVGGLSATLHEPIDFSDRQLQADLSVRRLHVDSLGVLTAHRRTGVGTRLMAAAQEWGRSRGAAVVLLEASAADPRSTSFYSDRLGFAAPTIVFRKAIR